MTENQFITLYTARQVAQLAKTLPAASIVLLDVDDTLITPVSNLFRLSPGEDSIIDVLKKNPDKYQNSTAIVSNWRFSRKTMLVDEDWPEVIEQMKELHPVYALTKMDTGHFGIITSMEEWRYNELTSLNLIFTDTGTVPPIKDGKPSLTHGIFMTGANPKSQVLNQLLPLIKVTHILFVDDNKIYLNDLANFCLQANIAFTGVHYCGVENIADRGDPEIKALQTELLIGENRWLEDNEAAKLIDSSIEVSFD